MNKPKTPDRVLRSNALLSGEIERLATGWCLQQGLIETPKEQRIDWNRVPDVEYGDRIEIIWGGQMAGIIDVGLVVPFPGQDELDANMGGLVWIESPDNPGGKDRVPPQWETLHMLRTSPDVAAVRVVRSSR